MNLWLNIEATQFGFGDLFGKTLEVNCMKYKTYAEDMTAIYSLLMAGEIDEWEAAQMRMYVSNLAVN